MTISQPLIPRLFRRQAARGQSYVEFAFVLPILLLLIFIIVDLGRITYTYSTLHNAAREGARFGTVNFNWESPDDVADRVRQFAIGLSLDPNDLTVTVTTNNVPPTNSTLESTITVDAAYKFRTVTPILFTLIGLDEYTLRTKSTMILEYLEK